MQVTETSSEGLKRAYKVVVSADHIDTAYRSKLKEIGRQVRLPGFRPGKVPMPILKQRYGQSVIGEVLEQTVNDTSRQTMTDRGIRPAMEPKIAIQTFDEGKDLEYTIEVEILPDFDVPEFSDISIERPVVEVTDETIDDTMATLATQHSTFNPPAEPRAAKDGDQLVLDCVATVDGEPIEELSRHGMEIVLGTSTFVPEVEQALIDRSVEDHVSVSAPVPEALGPADLAGRSAQFEIDLNEIREPVARTVDDDFAALFGVETVNELRGRIREEHERQYKQLTRSRAKRLLLDSLAEKCTFDLPEILVSTEFDTIWREIEYAKEHGQLTEAERSKPEDALKAEYREIAERRVKLGLLLSEVARKNSIEVSRDELGAAIVRESMRYGADQYQQVLAHIKENPAAIERFRAPLLEEKAVDFILELADVQDRPMSADALKQLLEEDEAADAGSAHEAATDAGHPDDGAGTEAMEAEAAKDADAPDNEQPARGG